MVTHTSHYAILASIAWEIVSAALSALVGQPISAASLSNPGALALAAVAGIDVVSRHWSDYAKSRISSVNGGQPLSNPQAPASPPTAQAPASPPTPQSVT